MWMADSNATETVPMSKFEARVSPKWLPRASTIFLGGPRTNRWQTCNRPAALHHQNQRCTPQTPQIPLHNSHSSSVHQRRPRPLRHTFKSLKPRPMLSRYYPDDLICYPPSSTSQARYRALLPSQTRSNIGTTL